MTLPTNLNLFYGRFEQLDDCLEVVMTELQTTSEDEEEVDICVGEVKGVFSRLKLS